MRGVARSLGAAVVGAAVAAAPLVTGLPAHAAATICVGVVVDARSLGGDLATGCARVPAGATGNQVMAAAGHRLSFRSDGLVCTIDGLPKDGCSSSVGNHFWSYWHRAPDASAWTYSTQGSGTYRPANESTEGWVWQDGGAEGNTRPPDVPYQHVCPAAAAPSPAATSRSATSPSAASTAPAATARRTPAPGRTAGAGPDAASATTSAAADETTAAAAAAARRAAPTAPSKTAGAATLSAAAAAGRPSRSPVAAAASGPAAEGNGFPTGVVAAVLLVGALGTAALVRSRRR